MQLGGGCAKQHEVGVLALVPREEPIAPLPSCTGRSYASLLQCGHEKHVFCYCHKPDISDMYIRMPFLQQRLLHRSLTAGAVRMLSLEQGGEQSSDMAACTRHPGPPVPVHAWAMGSAQRVLESRVCKPSLPKPPCRACFSAADLAPWCPSRLQWYSRFPRWVIICSLCPGSRLKSQQGRFKLNI